MPRGAPLKPGVLLGLLGYRLRLAQRAVFRDFASSVAELSPGRAGMLLLVEANPGVTQSRLAVPGGPSWRASNRASRCMSGVWPRTLPRASAINSSRCWKSSGNKKGRRSALSLPRRKAD